MAVRGNLRDMSLASLISVNCNERNQAQLTVRRQGQEAVLFFEDGNIVHMALGSQEGKEVIYELLTWEEGEFELEHHVPPPEHTVTTGWCSLLLEGVHRIDENMVGGPESLEEREESRKDMVGQDLVGKLKKVEGVAGAVIVAKDGIVIAHDLEGEVEKEGAVAVFVGNAASEIGEAMALGPLESAVVEMGSARAKMLVLEQPDYCVGLLLDERASPALIASQARGILE